jgi:hypothetical protein
MSPAQRVALLDTKFGTLSPQPVSGLEGNFHQSGCIPTQARLLTGKLFLFRYEL